MSSFEISFIFVLIRACARARTVLSFPISLTRFAVFYIICENTFLLLWMRFYFYDFNNLLEFRRLLTQDEIL